MSENTLKNKRMRSQNFSKEEELALVNIIFQYKKVIENKASDTITGEKKENAWSNVLQEFNSSHKARTMHQIKSKFDNLKTSARKYATLQQENLIKTGGGGKEIETDPVLDVILSIINKKTVFGLNNPFDDDYLEIEHTLTSHNEMDTSEIIDCDIPVIHNVPGTVDVPTAVDFTEQLDNDGEGQELTTWTLTLPVSEIVPSTSNIDTETDQSPVNWAKYTPKMLARKQNEKLSVKNKITAKKEQERGLHSLKQRVLEQKLLNLKNEERRKEEFFKKQMELIQLQIENEKKKK